MLRYGTYTPDGTLRTITLGTPEDDAIVSSDADTTDAGTISQDDVLRDALRLTEPDVLPADDSWMSAIYDLAESYARAELFA